MTPLRPDENPKITSDLTPMMRQYLEVKEELKDSILFFRLGDFYEMFFDDAKEASRILHIALTSREAGKGNKVPMCGIPYHAADNYIARLIKNGKKIAICEQVEEPTPGKKLVDRKVIKVITPGTYISDELLGGTSNNYLLSIYPHNNVFGMAYADISTGEFRVTELDDTESLFAELYKISPSECIIPESFSKDRIFEETGRADLGVVTVYDDWMFDYEVSLREIKSHFSVKDLSGFGCQDMGLAVRAAGALLKYLKNTQKTDLGNVDVIKSYRVSQFMTLDRNSQRNLELVQNMEDLTQEGTLFGVLDEADTPMGKRKLKDWILNPLLDIKAIGDRLDAVQYFYDDGEKRAKIKKILEGVHDIDRLSNKVSLESANARDMVALGSSLKNMKEIRQYLAGVELPRRLKEVSYGLDDFDDIIGWIESTLVEEPPLALKDGGLIKTGHNKEIDGLKSIITKGKDWLVELKGREIKRTGINSLKVGYNTVFGYYIEVTNANLGEIPKDYIRKQTLVNAERFITEELKEYESKIIGAGDRIKMLEYEEFCALRRKIGSEIERLKRSAGSVAELDVAVALAEVAARNGYVRPDVNSGTVIRVKEGRHPVVERLLKEKEFVPNDVELGDKKDIFIITGSNMAGKSTFIRQIALLSVMAQMGSFVPAKEAVIGVVDRVFTRVGASDRLHKGMSTFMVEMLEAANILNNATKKSLIILDEIGRGTSTFDGVSIAWAMVEYINKRLHGAKTLFATHFHELTELSEMLDNVKNYNMATREWKDEIIFLYKVVEGSCDESFGVHVAKLAGMPAEVVKRAREILNNLQKDSLLGNIRARFSGKEEPRESQLSFFGLPDKNVENPVVKKLREIEINDLTPLEALKKLSEFKKEAGA